MRHSREARHNPAEGHPACEKVTRRVGNTSLRRGPGFMAKNGNSTYVQETTEEKFWVFLSLSNGFVATAIREISWEGTVASSAFSGVNLELETIAYRRVVAMLYPPEISLLCHVYAFASSTQNIKIHPKQRFPALCKFRGYRCIFSAPWSLTITSRSRQEAFKGTKLNSLRNYTTQNACLRLSWSSSI